MWAAGALRGAPESTTGPSDEAEQGRPHRGSPRRSPRHVEDNQNPRVRRASEGSPSAVSLGCLPGSAGGHRGHAETDPGVERSSGTARALPGGVARWSMLGNHTVDHVRPPSAERWIPRSVATCHSSSVASNATGLPGTRPALVHDAPASSLRYTRPDCGDSYENALGRPLQPDQARGILKNGRLRRAK